MKPEPNSEIILYQTEDNRTRIEVRLEDETVWLTQRQLAELFQKDVRTINEHIQNIFEEGELQRGATIRKFRIVQAEGARSIEREVDFYNLDMRRNATGLSNWTRSCAPATGKSWSTPAASPPTKRNGRRNWSLTSSTASAASWKTPKPTRSSPRKLRTWPSKQNN
jgi:hypothetical protein